MPNLKQQLPAIYMTALATALLFAASAKAEMIADRELCRTTISALKIDYRSGHSPEVAPKERERYQGAIKRLRDSRPHFVKLEQAFNSALGRIKYSELDNIRKENKPRRERNGKLYNYLLDKLTGGNSVVTVSQQKLSAKYDLDANLQVSQLNDGEPNFNACHQILDTAGQYVTIQGSCQTVPITMMFEWLEGKRAKPEVNADSMLRSALENVRKPAAVYAHEDDFIRDELERRNLYCVEYTPIAALEQDLIGAGSKGELLLEKDNARKAEKPAGIGI